jgi:hypothetical protein
MGNGQRAERVMGGRRFKCGNVGVDAPVDWKMAAKARRETASDLTSLIDNGGGRLAVLGQVKPAGLLEDVGTLFHGDGRRHCRAAGRVGRSEGTDGRQMQWVDVWMMDGGWMDGDG